MHPGSTLGSDKPSAIKQIGDSINEMHGKTEFVKIVLENMTGQDRIVGSNIADLRDIITYVKNKERVGVCIDTCHSFCAGYDLRTENTFNKFWDLFDKTVGYKYLSGIHLNDSKFPFDSKRDVHYNIGLGFLGLEAFRLIMNKEELQNIPLILETPIEHEDGKTPDDDPRADEIALLRWLVGKEKDDKEVLDKSIQLQKLGAKVREKNLLVVDKKKPISSKKPVKNDGTITFAKAKKVKTEVQERNLENQETALESELELKDEQATIVKAEAKDGPDPEVDQTDVAAIGAASVPELSVDDNKLTSRKRATRVSTSTRKTKVRKPSA
ncbi:DNA-(apurinic or apyrimidinic site) lyase APN1 [Sugiyamaella lignohabitans]|uniref:DNA-(Apurinic or apyrimidinic site) lyase APN1 n=1 Tax=Sugiyamaella lignohabitans TaxID=796027 RepID=A0A167C4G9_9ASCO|nr:DNA-(apurinic or apyrimidinic site) lyase APN1 [Sugiyamaella lignohabitans]ANB11204.1 DNA-(apurinic or apyrimidinic site) lyase APN1 [Sugiyamaella lignohabitans]